ncbi:MAG: hypothetical protein IH623_18555 [Verrucomicrobia bacterium]|nr:hypothetical protein [Verrucomicrobiota bacterium]
MAAREEETDALRDALKHHAADMVIDRALKQPKRGAMVKALLERFDQDGDGELNAEERAGLRTFIISSGALPGLVNNTF